MTAYAPRHAFTRPRTYRAPLWRRARRLLTALLPARTVTLPAPPFADRFPCCEHCTDGSPCDPVNNHRVPCADGCNDPLLPVTLTDTEIAALRPLWAVRRDGLVTVTADGSVEVYPAPLAWETSAAPTGAQPALDEEAADLARAERIRGELPACTAAPETLERVLDGLRNLPVVPGFMRPEYGVRPVAEVLEAERLAGVMLP